jgi:hypothetical protein
MTAAATVTLATLQQLRQNDPTISIINLSRNFGKEIALSAGLDHSRGDAVIVIFGDFIFWPVFKDLSSSTTSSLTTPGRACFFGVYEVLPGKGDRSSSVRGRRIKPSGDTEEDRPHPERTKR